MDLFCDEPVAALLEVPDAQCNTLDTPDELLEAVDIAADSNLGALPLHNDDDHALRLHVLLELEAGQLTTDYLRRQPHFDATHRFAIVQWLHVACFHFKLNLSALAIAVRLLDRFLDVCLVPMDQLRNAQCVAVACLTLAAKLDGPEAVDNVARFQVDTEIWSTSFSAGQIRGMELMICSTLDWRMHCATPVDFMDCLLCLANVGRCPDGTLLHGGRPAARVRSMAHTLICQTLADSSSVAMPPSCMAAASILAALRTCHGNGPELMEALCCFSNHIHQDQMQWCLDQLKINSGRSAASSEDGSGSPLRGVSPPPPPPPPPPLLAIPVNKPQQLAACAYSKDDCSPTSVLTSLPGMPGCSQDMSCDSSCDSI